MMKDIRFFLYMALACLLFLFGCLAKDYSQHKPIDVAPTAQTSISQNVTAQTTATESLASNVVVAAKFQVRA